MTTWPFVPQPPSARLAREAVALHWLLRGAVLGCFFGHGAFGILTKAEWLPLFEVFHIPEASAWRIMLGCCKEITADYAPCWGRRTIKPVEGWLTLFPSQLFHDVVPSGTASPRVSVAADMRPVAG